MASIEEESDQSASNTSDRAIITDDKYDRNKVAVLLKLIVIVTIAIFLLCQMVQLLRLYYDYNTNVSVHYEYSAKNQFPSFTICLPAIVDRHKLIQKYPDLQIKLNQTINEEERENLLTEYLDKTLDSMIWKELSIGEEEAFNCSLNYWPFNWFESTNNGTNRFNSVNCRDVVKPIEHFANNKGKCFTYFSQLQTKDNFIGEYSLKDGVKNLNDMSQILSIDFKLDFHKYLALGFIENYTTLAIHHQRMLPNIETETQLIDSGQQYDVTLNMISSKLLPKPYKTMCHYYNRQNNGLMSREDCIDNCVVDLYRDKCQCRPYYLTNAIQLLNSSTQLVCSRQDLKIMSNPCYEKVAKEVALCLTLDRCPQDCESIKYNYRTRSQRLSPELIETNRLFYENRVVIKLRFDQSIGNTIIRHTPSMSFGQLLCYISSIVAIFSGLSLIGITNLIIDKTLSIQLLTQLLSKKRVSDEKIHTITGNQQIQQNKRWRIIKSKDKRDCISSCFGSPSKQMLPWKKTTTTLYTSNIVDVISGQK